MLCHIMKFAKISTPVFENNLTKKNKIKMF